MGPVAHLINDNLVETLSKRLYPEKLTVMAKTELLTDDKRQQAVSYIKDCEEYEAELCQLSEAALLALAEDEFDQDELRQNELAEEEESNRFFYDRSSRADFSDWIDRETWTVNEATALLLGKNPDIVNWNSVNPLVYKSRFAKRFAELREKITDDLNANKIHGSKTPAAYLHYASSIGFVLPADFQILLLPPKTNAEKDEHTVQTLDDGAASFRRLIEHNKKRLAQQHEPVDGPEPAASNSSPAVTETSHAELERRVLLKMLGAIADSRYGFDPLSDDLHATHMIVDDFRDAGISASLQSVHKLFCEASRLNRSFDDQESIL